MTKTLPKSPHTLDLAANVIMMCFKAAFFLIPLTEVKKVEKEKTSNRKPVTWN